jgi:hypothetical protein
LNRVSAQCTRLNFSKPGRQFRPSFRIAVPGGAGDSLLSTQIKVKVITRQTDLRITRAQKEALNSFHFISFHHL